MADIDYAKFTGTTYSSTLSGTNSSNQGAEANCHDDNNTTYYIRAGGGMPWGGSASLSFTATFAKAHNINHIQWYILVQAYGFLASASWTLSYVDGSGSHTLDSGGILGGSAVSKNYTGLTLTGVTSVTFSGTGSASGGGPGVPSAAGIGCYEVYAYGPEEGGGTNMMFML